MSSEQVPVLRVTSWSQGKLGLCYCVVVTSFCVCFMGAFFSPGVMKSEEIQTCGGEVAGFVCKENRQWVGDMRGTERWRGFIYLEADTGNLTERYRGEVLVSVISWKDNSESYTYLLLNKPITVSSDHSTQLFYEAHISSPNYLLKVAVLPPPPSDFHLSVSTLNPGFVYFMLSVRYIFLVLCTVSSLWYWKQVRRFGMVNGRFEMKYVGVLGLSCWLYDDPLAICEFLVPHWVWSIYKAAVTAQFITMLVGFWPLCALRLRESTLQKYYLVGILMLLGLLFVFLAVLYASLDLVLRFDPAYAWSSLPAEILLAAVLSLAVILLLVLVAGLLTARATPVLLQLGQRVVLQAAIHQLVMMFIVLGTCIGAFQLLPRVSRFFLMSISGSNLYVCLLQTLYSPCQIMIHRHTFSAVELVGDSPTPTSKVTNHF